MKIGRVIGEVWATAKEQTLEGKKIMASAHSIALNSERLSPR